MEDGMNLPLGGNAEVECCLGDYFFHFEGPVRFIWSFLGPFM